jgi:hypothetical protein
MTDTTQTALIEHKLTTQAHCQLCGEACEEPEQVEGAELCNSCARYLDARFAPLDDVLCDPAVQAAIEAEDK